MSKLIHRNFTEELNAQKQSIPLILKIVSLNTMVVDSTHLTKQIINDLIILGFDRRTGQ
ncbi:MAG: hypothetical protein ACTS7E_04080 [Arsenophonus sp. NC-CH8-MAG3]